MIEFHQLERLLMIVREGILSKATEVLLIPQPTLPLSMQRWEELGIKLFNRKKNKIELNQNGKLTIELFEKLLNEKNKGFQLYRFIIVIGLKSISDHVLQLLSRDKNMFPQNNILIYRFMMSWILMRMFY